MMKNTIRIISDENSRQKRCARFFVTPPIADVGDTIHIISHKNSREKRCARFFVTPPIADFGDTILIISQIEILFV